MVPSHTTHAPNTQQANDTGHERLIILVRECHKMSEGETKKES